MTLDDIPEGLRRDKNNRAPFMDAPLVVKRDGSMQIGSRTVVGVVLDPLFSPASSPPVSTPLIGDVVVRNGIRMTVIAVRGAEIECAWSIDGDIVEGVFPASPASSPPAQGPCWVPPWGSKS